MSVAERFDDRRRTKWKMFNQSSGAVSLAEKLIQEMDARPVNKFMVGDIVYADNAYREIQMKHYAPASGWMYRFSESRRYTYNLPEVDIVPLFHTVGDKLLLPSGVERELINIKLSPNKQPLFIFEIRQKQYTIYSYKDILKVNPPSDFSLLKFVWDSLGQSQSNQTYVREISEQINPLLAL